MNIAKNADTFRKRLKRERLKSKLSQVKLAEAIGCDHSAISYLESGKNKTPKFQILVGAAMVFRCSIDYLCGVKNE